MGLSMSDAGQTGNQRHRLASVYKHLAKYDNIDRKRKAPLTLQSTDDRCILPLPLETPPTKERGKQIILIGLNAFKHRNRKGFGPAS
jgi:hypothetical protein